jgi:hypothetical protein
MDMAYEKLLNMSPVNPNNKLSIKESDEDFAKNFKIKLIDANTDNNQNNIEKNVQPKFSYNRKSTLRKDSNFMLASKDGELSPIKERGEEKYLNETIVLQNDNEDTSLDREEKLKKKLGETLMLMSKYNKIKIIYRSSKTQ